MQYVFLDFTLSMQHLGERANTDWLVIRIMCPIGATCLSADYCFTINKKCAGQVQSGPHHISLKTCSRHYIAVQLLS